MTEEGDKVQKEATDILRSLDGHARPPVAPALRGRVDLLDPRLCVIAGHLSQGGHVALLEPFLVTRPGQRGGTLEFRLVAMVGG